MAGHGNKYEIIFDISRYIARSLTELQRITIRDTAFTRSLSMFDSSAAIFSISCSNGQGGEEGNNLANFLSKESGRTVYSLNRPGNLCDFKVKSFYPFVLENAHVGRNALYVARP